MNNDVARIGGLIAVAVLPALGEISGLSYLHPLQALTQGFQRAVVIARLVVRHRRGSGRGGHPQPG